MKSLHSFKTVTVFILILIFICTAQVPRLINYQGKLSDNTGTPLTGDHNLHFSIFTTEEGGAPIWQETQNAIAVNNGYFHTLLGTTIPIPQTVFNNNEILYLEITVDSETLDSRFQLTSVAFAFKAAYSDSSGKADPVGNAAGDLNGTYPAPTVTALQNNAVSATTPSAGQVLKWNNSQWEPGADAAGGAVTVSTRLSGSGESGSPLDIAQQGATTGQVLKWNNSQWEPGADVAGGAVTVSTRLSGSGESGSPLDIAQQAATTGQILEWGGASWAPGNKATGDITGVTAGDGLSGGGISGSVGLDIGGGTGITVTADNIALNTIYTDSRYVNESQGNSVTNAMIVAETGFSFSALSDFSLSDETTNQTVGSVSITAPAAGYVVVQSTGYIEVNHTTGTSDNIFINLLTSESGTVASSGRSGFAVASAAPTYWLNRGSFASQNMFTVTASQNLTIYLVIRQTSGANVGSTVVGGATIQAVFYPTQY